MSSSKNHRACAHYNKRKAELKNPNAGYREKTPNTRKKHKNPRVDSPQNVPKQKTIGRAHSKQIAKKHSKNPKAGYREKTLSTRRNHKNSRVDSSQNVPRQKSIGRALIEQLVKKNSKIQPPDIAKRPRPREKKTQKPKGRFITKRPQTENHRTLSFKTDCEETLKNPNAGYREKTPNTRRNHTSPRADSSQMSPNKKP